LAFQSDLWLSSSDGRILRLDARIGSPEPALRVPAGGALSTVGDAVVMVVRDDVAHQVARLNPASGRVLWRGSLRAVGPSVVAGRLMWTPTVDGRTPDLDPCQRVRAGKRRDLPAVHQERRRRRRAGSPRQQRGHWTGPLDGPSLDQIATEVAGGRPVVASIVWPGGKGQEVAIAGVLNDLLLVGDPAHGETVIPYGNFSASYQGGAAWPAGR
jgi:hypothetical protein